MERLVTAIWPEAYRLSYTLLGNRAAAEDAAQESCAAVIRSLHALKDPQAFGSWFYRIVANNARTLHRRRVPAEPLDSSAAAVPHFDNTEAVELHEALHSLSLFQRAAVVLHYYAGFTSAEIAAATGVPASTIRFHLMLARRALRKILAEDDECAPGRAQEIANVQR